MRPMRLDTGLNSLRTPPKDPVLSTLHSRIHTITISFAIGLLIALFFQHSAVAQPSGARGDDFIYRVVQHDTLIDLSSRFTGTPNNWPVLQSINGVADPYALRIGRELRIPFALIPEVETVADVTHVVGQALINSAPARPRDSIREGDLLSTRAHSFVTFELPDGSISALPPETAVRFQRLRAFQGTGIVDAILQLDQGGLESAVAPDGRGVGRFEVRTPVSITGVRGTRLRVRSDAQGAHTEVLSGAAQLGTRLADGPRLRALQGTAVMPDGTILAARPLLAAPVLLPDADHLRSRSVMFEPVPGAVAYQVRVAADEAGTQPVWTDTISMPPLHYRTPGGGTWFVLVRAVDDLGLMSDDARLQVSGGRVLISRSGSDVMTRFDGPVRLTDY